MLVAITSTDGLQWASLVGVPLILGVLGLLGRSLSSRIRSVEEKTSETANSVRPNGSGHGTLTAISEDILLNLGEVRGEVKNINKDIKNINTVLEKHLTDDRNSFETISAALKKMGLSD